MATTFRVTGVIAPTGVSVRARLYVGSGTSSAADLALTESPSGSGQYGAESSVSGLSDGAYEYEVRQVATQDASGFTSSATVRRSRGGYGYLASEVWYDRPPSTGGGAFARTIIATTDGTTALVGAQIRLTSGASTFHGTSGSDGSVVFSVDAGTYTLSATASGRTYTPSTLVVSASGTTTITLTAVSIPPAADPSQTTAYLTCRDGQGAAKASAVVYFRLKAPAGTADAWDRYDFSATSNGSGSLTVTLGRLASYEAKLGDRGAWVAFTTTDTSTYALPQILGQYGR